MAQVTENEVDEDFSRNKNNASFKEPFVLLGIICLTFLNAVNKVQNSYRYTTQRNLMTNESHLTAIFVSTCITAVPLPGLMGLTFISEITGRKPVFITLFAFSTISSLLTAVGQYEMTLLLSFVIQGLVSGGTLAMTFLAISEYCIPKHRFAYLMANALTSLVGFYIVSTIYDAEVLAATSIVVPILTIILGLAGLGSVCLWPESPHWLASQGRLVESKKAFLWLRGEQSETEFRALKQEQRRPGPPQLYWLTLLIAIATLSITLFCDLQEIVAEIFMSRANELFSSTRRRIVSLAGVIVIGSILILISYKVKRKVVVTVTSIIPLLLFYVLGLWMYLRTDSKITDSFFWFLFISNILRTVGPGALGLAVFIETIPLKYNTHMTCVCFVFYHVVNTFHSLIFANVIDNPTTFTVLLTTFSVFGLVLFYFLAQEPKGKTLLEIQKSYTPNGNVASIETVPIPMQQMQKDKDQLDV